MTRRQYLEAVIGLYLAAPDTPNKARRRDWAIAGALYNQQVPLETLAHAIRLATLRRHLRPDDDGDLEPIHSLAYYRDVVRHLTPEANDPGYVQYVTLKHRQLLDQLASSTHHSDSTPTKPERRASR